jgi:hypothetical protein
MGKTAEPSHNFQFLWKFLNKRNQLEKNGPCKMLNGNNVDNRLWNNFERPRKPLQEKLKFR